MFEDNLGKKWGGGGAKLLILKEFLVFMNFR